MDEGKSIGAPDLEVLLLLRNFFKIGDPKLRREIIMLAEKLASSPIDDSPALPSLSPPDEAGR